MSVLELLQYYELGFIEHLFCAEHFTGDDDGPMLVLIVCHSLCTKHFIDHREPGRAF